LAKLMALDMGKLIKQGEGEIESCARIAEYYANHAKEFLAPVSLLENGPPVGYPIQYRVSGEDLGLVRQWAQRVAQVIGKNPN
uniref:hypothetical protein n=1 Tax=Acinetobacter radioresistens TaxID=40216 RepID=UPI00125F48B8